MSNLLDDESEETLEEQQRAHIHVLGWAFLAKWLLELYLHLQQQINGRYLTWLAIVIQLALVQQALYAIYSRQDKRLLCYLRYYYLGIAGFFFSAALLFTNDELLTLGYYLEWPIRELLDNLFALLLIRYYYTLQERPAYWNLLERLVWWSLGVMVVVRLWRYSYYVHFYNQQDWLGNTLDWGFQIGFVVGGFWLLSTTYKTIAIRNRWLAVFSVATLLCWKSALYFQYLWLVLSNLILFVAAILGVLAFTSSFAEADQEE